MVTWKPLIQPCIKRISGIHEKIDNDHVITVILLRRLPLMTINRITINPIIYYIIYIVERKDKDKRNRRNQILCD